MKTPPAVHHWWKYRLVQAVWQGAWYEVSKEIQDRTIIQASNSSVPLGYKQAG